MRILYSVHGYGRGHATRTLAVLPHLAARHQVQILAGGDAYSAISPDYPAVRLPTLRFVYDRGRRQRQRSNWRTLRRNLPAVLDLLYHGPTFDMIRELVQDFSPDVIISDAEAWAHHVAADLKVPRIGFDHVGILSYCRPPVEWRDRLKVWFDRACYRQLTGRPERVIVSSFYPAPPVHSHVRVVGTLPRQEVRGLTPAVGEHLLVYFNRGQDQLDATTLRALDEAGCPVHVYGSGRRGRHGNLTFLPPSNLPFLEDLAGCRAVVSTAGNQLVGEAIFLRKPILVVPERCVEQRLNAAAVERLGIGERVTGREFTTARLRRFLDRADQYREAMRRHTGDGLPDALDAIERFLIELAPRAASSSNQGAACR